MVFGKLSTLMGAKKRLGNQTCCIKINPRHNSQKLFSVRITNPEVYRSALNTQKTKHETCIQYVRTFFYTHTHRMYWSAFKSVRLFGCFQHRRKYCWTRFPEMRTKAIWGNIFYHLRPENRNGKRTLDTVNRLPLGSLWPLYSGHGLFSLKVNRNRANIPGWVLTLRNTTTGAPRIASILVVWLTPKTWEITFLRSDVNFSNSADVTHYCHVQIRVTYMDSVSILLWTP